MQLMVDISDEQLERIEEESKKREMSRDDIIREALSRFLLMHGLLHQSAPLVTETDRAFGLWAGRGIDSMDAESTRDEWRG